MSVNRRILRYKSIRNLRKPKIYRKRFDSFENYDDDEFYERYRFDRTSVLYLTDCFCRNLERATQRSQAVSPTLQMLVTLRYLASNSFQQVVGDTVGLEKSTVCRIVWPVIRSMVSKVNDFIEFPEEVELERVQSSFLEKVGFPGVSGTIDCTHVEIPAPIGQEFAYMDRKGRKTLNVQAICMTGTNLCERLC